MRSLRIGVAAWVVSTGLAAAQSPPQLIPLNGMAIDVAGQPRAGVMAITFAIYEEQIGGVPLWVEIQSVATDAQGAFTALLGATSPAGVLVDLFTRGQPRWIGVQVEGQAEQPRSLFVSVPYALKAADADTVGGLPVSAFLLTQSAAAASGDPTTGSATVAGNARDRDGAEGETADVTTQNPDIVYLDDVIIDGSLCAGFDCVNGENFGFDTIRVKENNLRIHFDDTSNTASFPANDWRLIANDSANGGDSYYSVEDASAGRRVFTLEAGARANALYVDSQGDVGIGTSTPAVDLEIKTGNTPTTRLQQDGTSGFAPQTWDMAGNEANFFIRDVTNGSKLPFRIRPGASDSSIDIAATGYVGLGTSSPVTRLEVEDSSATTGIQINNKNAEGDPFLAFAQSAAEKFTMGVDGSDSDKFKIGTTAIDTATRLSIDASGNIGIGTATPATIFEIEAASVELTLDSTVGAGRSWELLSTTAGEFEIVDRDAVASRLAITTSGEVGIGTTAPATMLEIEGAAVELTLDSTSGSGRAWELQSSTAGDFEIVDRDAAASRLAIGTSGSVGIGTTSPATMLELEAASVELTLDSTGGSGRAWELQSTTAGEFEIVDRDATASRLLINTSGNVGIGTANPSSALEVTGSIEVNGAVVHASDLKWKDHITTIDDAVSKVMHLRGVEFEWRREEFTHMRFEAGTQLGFVAQEVEPILPEVVRTDPDGHKSVAYANVTALLIEAVKEQQAEIARLRAQIESLAADVRRSQ